MEKELPKDIQLKKYQEAELQQEWVNRERTSFREDIRRSTALVFEINPDINYSWNYLQSARGISKDSYMKAEDALLRMRVMTDPRAQELFPELAA